MASELDDDAYERELGGLRGEVKQLSGTLQAVLLRIDELEGRRRNAELRRPIAVDVSSPRGTKDVRVEESVDEDGARVRRIHVTEKVVTTKTFQALNSPDCEYASLPFHDNGAAGNNSAGGGGAAAAAGGRPDSGAGSHMHQLHGSPRPAAPVNVGWRWRHKNDDHLMSGAYGARLVRLRTGCGPSAAGSLTRSSPLGEHRLADDAATLIECVQGVRVHAESGQLVVDECAADSPLAKAGLLRPGDFILEVNGREVRTKDDLEQAVRAAGDFVTLKIVPGHAEQPDPNAKYVKALINYDPTTDSDLSCKPIGLPFRVGDVLQVLSYDDDNYWQARKVNDMSRVGLVPAKKFEESRRPGYSLNGPADDKCKCVYEEVGKLTPYGRHVLVLLGAAGVGRRTLKAMLLAHDKHNFATVVPHTSRPKRPNEQEGREYHFDQRPAMQREIDRAGYVEWGEYNGNLYGTTVGAVRDVIRSGRVCVLDCSPQAARYLYTREFMPYVVFVAPPSFDELKQLYQVHPPGRNIKPKSDADLHRTCDESNRLEAQYKGLVDLILVNRNVDVTFRRLADALESLKTEPQWVPANWLTYE